MLHTDSLYILMFGSGLLGGFGHCIGMCGPVVTVYALNSDKRSYIPHILYNLGRITTYTIIGGLMGLTGSFVGVVQYIERFQNITMRFIGVLMIFMGLTTGGWLPFKSVKAHCSWVSGFITRVTKFISETRTTDAYFSMGLVLGFIPCGLLYTAFIAAAGAGVSAGNQVEGFLKGMLMLLLFGLGTSLSLLILGRVVSISGERLRNRLYRASAIIMIFVGVLFVYRTFQL